MRTLWAENALTAAGWRSGVRLTINDDGRIDAVSTNTEPAGERVATLLPAPANLHSHAFQRAMAGLSEKRGPDARDSFWTWRQLMYRFLDHLRPEDIEAIAAYVQMESLEAGYASIGEFHYVHHQPGGQVYENPAELALRVIQAAKHTGIGLTLLPVLYQQAGCDGAALSKAQSRFGCDNDLFEALWRKAGQGLGGLDADACIGVAPHSLRAVSPSGLNFVAELAPSAPIHIHVAEQTAEVDEVESAYGARPVAWLLANMKINSRWCFIHATHMTRDETKGLALSGATAGLCPITESNLGDGIFDGVGYLAVGGRFGIGTDANIRISLTEELRTLEYSQRLRDHGRSLLASHDASTGKTVFDGACRGGAAALGRASGAIAPGLWADLLALDGDCVDLIGVEGDDILDTFVFASGDDIIKDVWSAGRHVVKAGRHIERTDIESRYRQALTRLRQHL